MPRRTKEEAQQTRNDLLDAAERVFEARGVSGASLQEVAQAAGVTRGAVYWHFEGKVELFNALMDRAILPFEQDWLVGGPDDAADPLGRLREVLCDILRQTAQDARLQRALTLATQKVEYVGELDGIRQRRLKIRDRALRRMERLLRLAAAAGQWGASTSGSVPARVAARSLHALVDGLITSWMLDKGAFDLARVGPVAVDQLITGLQGPAGGRASAQRPPAPRRATAAAR